tara:strand:- start:119 stop:499 length:381 start_codon:yes stop_codon:yes gene_type:complete
MADNIIQFPKDKMKTPPQSKKELDQELLNNKVAYVEDVATHYGSSVFNKLAMHGFNVDDDNFIKDYAYVIESLKSCLLNNVGVTHPIQKTVIEDVNKFYGVDVTSEYLTEEQEEILDEMEEEDKLL